MLEKQAESSAALESARALCWELPAGCKSCPQAHPKVLGVLGTKGVQLHSHSTASEEGSGQGTGGKRCSVPQGRNMTNLHPPGEEYDKFRSQSSKCSHRTLALGFQGFVEFKQVSSGQGREKLRIQTLQMLQFVFPSTKSFPLKSRKEKGKNQTPE